MSGKPTGGKWVVVTSRDVHPCVVSNGVAVICMDVENPADAEFIAEAGTVYNATGLGPREMQQKVAELEAEVARLNLIVNPPIPDGVYYSAANDNFYARYTRDGMGLSFYEEWQHRRDEFPQGYQAAIDIDLARSETE